MSFAIDLIYPLHLWILKTILTELLLHARLWTKMTLKTLLKQCKSSNIKVKLGILAIRSGIVYTMVWSSTTVETKIKVRGVTRHLRVASPPPLFFGGLWASPLEAKKTGKMIMTTESNLHNGGMVLKKFIVVSDQINLQMFKIVSSLDNFSIKILDASFLHLNIVFS